jgi:hypothetical protein
MKLREPVVDFLGQELNAGDYIAIFALGGKKTKFNVERIRYVWPNGSMSTYVEKIVYVPIRDGYYNQRLVMQKKTWYRGANQRCIKLTKEEVANVTKEEVANVTISK